MGWTSSQVLHTDLCKIIQNSYFMDKSVSISLIDTQPFFNFNLMREYFIWRFKNYNSSDVPRCRFLIFNKFYQLIYDAGGWVGRSNFINGRSHKTIIEKVGRGGGEGGGDWHENWRWGIKPHCRLSWTSSQELHTDLRKIVQNSYFMEHIQTATDFWKDLTEF